MTTSVAALERCLAKEVETRDLGAFLHLNANARAEAVSADQRRQRNEALGPLDGLPIALKDILATRDMPTTCGSRLLEGYVPPYDATVVEKLRAAGAVLLGKTNLDEFAMGSATEHSAFGLVHHPLDRERVPGGSSGGSAVAVATGSAWGALGTDTGGSIRQPAAFCGVVGLKPTYGRVSRYGLVAYGSSLDQAGPLTRTVRDCALLLGAIAGHDPKDATSSTEPVPDFTATLDAGVRGLKLGVVPAHTQHTQAGIAPDIQRALARCVAALEAAGAHIVPIELPHERFGVACYYVLAMAEASSNLARFDGVRFGRRVDPGEGLLSMYVRTRTDGFGPEVKRRILLGTFALSSGYYDAYYAKAQRVRTLVCQDYARAFAQVDAILTPTTPTTAFHIGAHQKDPVAMYLEDALTVGCNLAGLPGLSVPFGRDALGLPIGLQVIGPAFSEARILQIGQSIEACGEVAHGA